MSLLRALKAEFAKVFTVRLWWILLLVLFVYVAFTAGMMAGVFGLGASGLSQAGLGGSTNIPNLPDGALPPIIYSLASSMGYVFPVLLGALATTSEFRHQTLTPTFLATPRRGIVLAAKYLCLAIIGAGYGVVALLGSAGVGAPLLSLTGHDPGLSDPDTWLLFGRIILVMAIWALVGVGLGVLIPSQVAAIVIVLVFAQFLEPILRLAGSFWDWSAQLARFLPGAAGDALAGSSIFSTFSQSTSGPGALPWWAGGLVLVGYAVVAGAVGWFTSWRKDVT